MKENKVTIGNSNYILGKTNVFESGEAYIIDNKPYLSKDCVFDHALSIYILKEKANHLINGYVGVDKDGNFIKGDFSPSLNNEVLVLDKNIIIINQSILDSKKYIRKNDNSFVPLDKAVVKNIYENFTITKDFKQLFPYGAGEVMDAFTEYFEKVEMKSTAGATRITEILNGLSVGVEFETSKGLLSKKECLMNGLIPLRDGSIDGLEYVTIPITDSKGIQGLINSISLLNDKTKIDHKCALHYHFGNIPRTTEFIVAFWIVITLIQDELYKYQSAYKRDNRGFKSKDYSKPLPNLLGNFDKVLEGKSLKNAYNQIIEFLSMGLFGGGAQPSLEAIEHHPADPHGSQKWHVKTRYTIANLVPLIYCNKKTVEFRHHDISLNPEIIINEMLINACIVRFVKDNSSDILKNKITQEKINLDNILPCYLKDDEINNIFNFLSQKRSDVNNCFLKGEHFKDFTNKSYYKVVKQNTAKQKIDNKFDIEFYEKYKHLPLIQNRQPQNRNRQGFRLDFIEPRFRRNDEISDRVLNISKNLVISETSRVIQRVINPDGTVSKKMNNISGAMYGDMQGSVITINSGNDLNVLNHNTLTLASSIAKVQEVLVLSDNDVLNIDAFRVNLISSINNDLTLVKSMITNNLRITSALALVNDHCFLDFVNKYLGNGYYFDGVSKKINIPTLLTISDDYHVITRPGVSIRNKVIKFNNKIVKPNVNRDIYLFDFIAELFLIYILNIKEADINENDSENLKLIKTAYVELSDLLESYYPHDNRSLLYKHFVNNEEPINEHNTLLFYNSGLHLYLNEVIFEARIITSTPYFVNPNHLK